MPVLGGKSAPRAAPVSSWPKAKPNPQTWGAQKDIRISIVWGYPYHMGLHYTGV